MIKTASQEKTWNQEMGPDGYSKSKQIDNEADGLSLAKELIRTAAICIQNFQRQQKPKPEPTRIQKYLIDFGIIEGICYEIFHIIYSTVQILSRPRKKRK